MSFFIISIIYAFVISALLTIRSFWRKKNIDKQTGFIKCYKCGCVSGIIYREKCLFGNKYSCEKCFK